VLDLLLWKVMRNLYMHGAKEIMILENPKESDY